MIALFAAFWVVFIVGFLCGAALFRAVCPVCRERWERDLDEWA